MRGFGVLRRSDSSSSEDGLFGDEMLLLEPVDADPPQLSEVSHLPNGQVGGAAFFPSMGARQQQGRVPDDDGMRSGQNAAGDGMVLLASADELATDRSTPEGGPPSSGGFGLLSSGGAGAGGGGGGAAGAGSGGRRVRGSGGGNVSSQQSAVGRRRRNSGSNAPSSYKETSSSEDRRVRLPAFAQHGLSYALLHCCRSDTICRASGPTRLLPSLRIT